MMKIKKIIAIITMIIVTLAISIVPCFALVNDGNMDEYNILNGYCTTIMIDNYAVVNNTFGGQSEYVFDSYNASFRASAFGDNYDNTFDVVRDTLGTEEQVIVETFFVMDPFFVDKSSDDYWPVLSVECVGNDGYSAPTGSNYILSYSIIDYDTQSVSSSFIQGFTYTGNINLNLRNMLSSYVDDGDIISCDLRTYTEINDVMHLSVSTECYGRSTQYVKGGIVKIQGGNFNILDFIGTTVDNFFGTEIFDGVTIGNLFLIVIAVPALIAVLRMLGGVG